MVRVTIDRLGLQHESTDVVLGGGVLAARQRDLLDGVTQRIHGYASVANVRIVDHPPVVGAALLGLDALGATPAAEARILSALLAKINIRAGDGLGVQ